MHAFTLAMGIAAFAPAAALAALPPTPMFETIGVEAGLPSSEVYDLAEDRDGHLWIATADGLARWDGVEFAVWRHDPDDPGSLPANNVQVVHVDREDRVWAGTEGGGLAMLGPERARFRRWRDAGDGSGFSGNDVWSIAQARDGAIWAGTFGAGLNRLDPGTGEVRVFRHDAGDARTIASDVVIALAEDAAGRWLVGTGAGLTVFERAPGAGDDPAVAQQLPRQIVTALRATRDGSAWVATRDALFRIADDGVPVPHALPYSAGPTGVVLDAAGRRWISTRQGIVLEENGAAHALQLGDPRRATLPGALVFDVLEDREHGLWFAIREFGLAHLRPQWRNFAHLRPPLVPGQPMLDEAVRAVAACPDGDVAAIGPRPELVRHDVANGRAVRIVPPAVIAPTARAFALACDAAGYWVGHRHGVLRFDPASGASEQWRTDDAASGLGAGVVAQILPDAGAAWVSVLGSGVFRLRPGAPRAEPFAAIGSEVQQLALRDGVLHAVGERGVFRIAPPRAPERVLEGAAYDAIAFAADGTPWLHEPGALSAFRDERGAWTPLERYGAAQGLPVAAASAIVVRDGLVHVAGRRGLWQVDRATRRARRLDRADGVHANEYADAPAAVTRDGVVFLAGDFAVVGFDPARLARNEVAPVLRIARLTVQRGDETLVLPHDGAIALRHDDRDLTVVARALSLGDPSANRYRFRLAGFDDEARDGGNRGERVFGRLPPGRYALEIAASNPAGVETRLHAPIDIVVAAPPWRRPWAWAGYAVLASLAAMLAFRAYRRRLERTHAYALALERRAAAERQDRAKSEFLADVGHEIRTPLTGVIGMTELLLRTPLDERQQGYARTVQRSGDHLLRLINDLLDLSRIEAGRLELDPQPVELRALLDEVATLEAPLALERGLSFEARYDESLPRTVRLDATRLRQVLLNLVGNAIKFTERGGVSIAFDRDPDAHDGLVASVADTGPGLSESALRRLFARYEQAGPSRGGTGLGLAISKRIAERMGGRVEVESVPGRGTTFRVALPLERCDATTIPDAAPRRSAARAAAILVVDDDATTREVLEAMLVEDGHAVDTGANGLDALRLIGERRYELVLLDLDLPGLDGFRLARLVRERGGATLPLVAVSARAEPDTAARCRAAGFDDFLRKPVDGATLAAAIARALEPRAAVDA